MNEHNTVKNGSFAPAGTLLYGKSMLSQLPYELELTGAGMPVMICDKQDSRKAVCAAALLNVELKLVDKDTIEDLVKGYDCLVVCGDHEFVSRFEADPRLKVWLMLKEGDLLSYKKPLTDITVADSRFFKKSGRVEQFLQRFSESVSAGLASNPVRAPIPSAFCYSSKTKVFYGKDALSRLSAITEEVPIRNPMVLTDEGIIAAGLLEPVKEILKSSAVAAEPFVFKDIPPDSDTETVNEISLLYKKEGCDGIIAVGGGSVLDTGKGVYLNVSLGSDDLARYAGSNRIPRLGTPFVAVPTTAGTGSEATKVAVISDKARGRKLLYVSSNLQPDFAILDSRMTVSLPPQLTSITGMDALSHAVEAFTCLGKNPVSDRMAFKAVELIRDNLGRVMREPQNPEVRLNLAIASNLAGQAFSNSMVGAVHTIGHSIGAVCHAPHGSCMAVLLPAVLEYNFAEIENHLSELLPALIEPDEAEKVPRQKRAAETIECIRKMNSLLRELTGGRHPGSLSGIADREGQPLVTKDDFEKIAELSIGDASIVYNPVELRRADILKILESCY